MSNSFHETYSKLSKLSKRELDELAKDPNSILQRLTEKNKVKRAVIKERKKGGSRFSFSEEE